MMDLEDFISQDELEPGRPFFTEALPCESCGCPCDSLVEADWEPGLMVGPCCLFYIPEPDSIEVCQELYDAICACKSIQSVVSTIQEHVPHCERCREFPPSRPQMERKQVQSEKQGEDQQRRAA